MRRPANKETVRNSIIRVRCTESEVALFKKKAAEKGFKSLSDFIRTLINEDTDPVLNDQEGSDEKKTNI